MGDKQVRYYEAIYEGFRARLQADLGYARLLTKNPSHPRWLVERGLSRLWTLGELAEYVDKLPHLQFRPRKEPTGGFGRNIDTFDRLRHWAYSHVAEARTRSYDAWRIACDQRAQELDQLNLPPMGWAEVKHIAKSVANWTWREYDGSSGTGKVNRYAQQLGKLGGRPGHGEPWKALGISRRQWFAVRQLPPDQMQARMKKWADHKNMLEQHRFSLTNLF